MRPLIKKVLMATICGLSGVLSFVFTWFIISAFNDAAIKNSQLKCEPQFAIDPIRPAVATLKTSASGPKYLEVAIRHIGAKNVPLYWYGVTKPKLQANTNVFKLSDGNSLKIFSGPSSDDHFSIKSTFGFSYRSTPDIGTIELLFPITNKATVFQDHRGAIKGLSHGAEQRYAVDIDAEIGTPVYASSNGIVAFTESRYPDTMCGDPAASHLGNDVTVRTNSGFDVSYGHLMQGSILVKEGQPVKKGEIIARVGASGASYIPHLHISASVITNDGVRTIPIQFTKCDGTPLIAPLGGKVEISGKCYFSRNG